MFDETGIVEFELERERNKRPDTNLDRIPSKPLGYGRIFFYLFVGILLFRAITETLHFIF